MKFKWYIEFPIILIMIIFAIVFAWNINLPSCNKAVINIQESAAKTENPHELSPIEIKWRDGKDLFKSNCAACHNPKADGVGPALKGATDRWKAAGDYQGKTGEEWLKIWVHNWNDVVKAGYRYGVDMANSRPAQMNTFPYLSNDDIDKIMFFVNSPEGAKPEVVTK